MLLNTGLRDEFLPYFGLKRRLDRTGNTFFPDVMTLKTVKIPLISTKIDLI